MRSQSSSIQQQPTTRPPLITMPCTDGNQRVPGTSHGTAWGIMPGRGTKLAERDIVFGKDSSTREDDAGGGSLVVFGAVS